MVPRPRSWRGPRSGTFPQRAPGSRPRRGRRARGPALQPGIVADDQHRGGALVEPAQRDAATPSRRRDRARFRNMMRGGSAKPARPVRRSRASATPRSTARDRAPPSAAGRPSPTRRASSRPRRLSGRVEVLRARRRGSPWRGATDAAGASTPPARKRAGVRVPPRLLRAHDRGVMTFCGRLVSNAARMVSADLRRVSSRNAASARPNAA